MDEWRSSDGSPIPGYSPFRVVDVNDNLRSSPDGNDSARLFCSESVISSCDSLQCSESTFASEEDVERKPLVQSESLYRGYLRELLLRNASHQRYHSGNDVERQTERKLWYESVDVGQTNNSMPVSSLSEQRSVVQLDKANGECPSSVPLETLSTDFSEKKEREHALQNSNVHKPRMYGSQIDHLAQRDNRRQADDHFCSPFKSMAMRHVGDSNLSCQVHVPDYVHEAPLQSSYFRYPATGPSTDTGKGPQSVLSQLLRMPPSNLTESDIIKDSQLTTVPFSAENKVHPSSANTMLPDTNTTSSVNVESNKSAGRRALLQYLKEKDAGLLVNWNAANSSSYGQISATASGSRHQMETGIAVTPSNADESDEKEINHNNLDAVKGSWPNAQSRTVMESGTAEMTYDAKTADYLDGASTAGSRTQALGTSQDMQDENTTGKSADVKLDVMSTSCKLEGDEPSHEETAESLSLPVIVKTEPLPICGKTADTSKQIEPAEDFPGIDAIVDNVFHAYKETTVDAELSCLAHGETADLKTLFTSECPVTTAEMSTSNTCVSNSAIERVGDEPGGECSYSDWTDGCGYVFADHSRDLFDNIGGHDNQQNKEKAAREDVADVHSKKDLITPTIVLDQYEDISSDSESENHQEVCNWYTTERSIPKVDLRHCVSDHAIATAQRMKSNMQSLENFVTNFSISESRGSELINIAERNSPLPLEVMDQQHQSQKTDAQCHAQSGSGNLSHESRDTMPPLSEKVSCMGETGKPGQGNASFCLSNTANNSAIKEEALPVVSKDEGYGKNHGSASGNLNHDSRWNSLDNLSSTENMQSSCIVLSDESDQPADASRSRLQVDTHATAGASRSVPQFDTRATGALRSVPQFDTHATGASRSVPQFDTHATGASRSVPQFDTHATGTSRSVPQFDRNATGTQNCQSIPTNLHQPMWQSNPLRPVPIRYPLYSPYLGFNMNSSRSCPDLKALPAYRPYSNITNPNQMMCRPFMGINSAAAYRPFTGFNMLAPYWPFWGFPPMYFAPQTEPLDLSLPKDLRSVVKKVDPDKQETAVVSASGCRRNGHDTLISNTPERMRTDVIQEDSSLMHSKKEVFLDRPEVGQRLQQPSSAPSVSWQSIVDKTELPTASIMKHPKKRKYVEGDNSGQLPSSNRKGECRNQKINSIDRMCGSLLRVVPSIETSNQGLLTCSRSLPEATQRRDNKSGIISTATYTSKQKPVVDGGVACKVRTTRKPRTGIKKKYGANLSYEEDRWLAMSYGLLQTQHNLKTETKMPDEENNIDRFDLSYEVQRWLDATFSFEGDKGADRNCSQDGPEIRPVCHLNQAKNCDKKEWDKTTRCSTDNYDPLSDVNTSGFDGLGLITGPKKKKKHKAKKSHHHKAKRCKDLQKVDALDGLNEGSTTMPRSIKHKTSRRSGPFVCEWTGCEQILKTRETLKVHMRRHTGEKPFACHMCDYRGCQVASLRWHLNRAHGEGNRNQSVCRRRCQSRAETIGGCVESEKKVKQRRRASDGDVPSLNEAGEEDDNGNYLLACPDETPAIGSKIPKKTRKVQLDPNFPLTMKIIEMDQVST